MKAGTATIAESTVYRAGDTLGYPAPPVREICRGGVWLVPPEQRPRGWERWSMAEPGAPVAAPEPLRTRMGIKLSPATNAAEKRREAIMPRLKEMRRQGLPLAEMAARFDISVSQVKNLLKGLPLTDEQRAEQLARAQQATRDAGSRRRAAALPRIRELLSQGHSIFKIADIVGLSRDVVKRAIAESVSQNPA